MMMMIISHKLDQEKQHVYRMLLVNGLKEFIGIHTQSPEQTV